MSTVQDKPELLNFSKSKNAELFQKDYENMRHFSDEKINEYGMLSENTLSEMAKKGDILALQTLADLVAFDDLEKSKNFLNEAVFMGQHLH